MLYTEKRLFHSLNKLYLPYLLQIKRIICIFIFNSKFEKRVSVKNLHWRLIIISVTIMQSLQSWPVLFQHCESQNYSPVFWNLNNITWYIYQAHRQRVGGFCEDTPLSNKDILFLCRFWLKFSLTSLNLNPECGNTHTLFKVTLSPRESRTPPS